jgi:hypothetical protein
MQAEIAVRNKLLCDEIATIAVHAFECAPAVPPADGQSVQAIVIGSMPVRDFMQPIAAARWVVRSTTGWTVIRSVRPIAAGRADWDAGGRKFRISARVCGEPRDAAIRGTRQSDLMLRGCESRYRSPIPHAIVRIRSVPFGHAVQIHHMPRFAAYLRVETCGGRHAQARAPSRVPACPRDIVVMNDGLEAPAQIVLAQNERDPLGPAGDDQRDRQARGGEISSSAERPH